MSSPTGGDDIFLLRDVISIKKPASWIEAGCIEFTVGENKLVTVMLCLERTFVGNSQIGTLRWGQFVQYHADFGKV